jgi:hypothetical protein
MDELMIMEHCWNSIDRAKPKFFEEKNTSATLSTTGFMVEKVALGHVSLRALRYSL